MGDSIPKRDTHSALNTKAELADFPLDRCILYVDVRNVPYNLIENFVLKSYNFHDFQPNTKQFSVRDL